MKKQIIIFFIPFLLLSSCSAVYLQQTSDIRPINAKASVSYAEGIRLDWETDWELAGFAIQRGSDPTKMSRISEVRLSTYLDMTVPSGVTYYYRIIGFNSKRQQIAESPILTGLRMYLECDRFFGPKINRFLPKIE